MSDDVDNGSAPRTDAGSGPGQPLTWPEIGLQPHRFAGIFRMLAGEERETFAADIAQNGLKQKVVVFGDAILDGRNRYLVLVEEGIFEPEEEHWRDRPELFTEFSGSETEALDFVWSLNEQRRHDSASQRAMSAERYRKFADITQAEAAARLGVSERQVSSAAKILEEGTPELIAAVDRGDVPAYLGEQLADLDEDDQREVASKPKGEAGAAARQKVAAKSPAQRISDKYIDESGEQKVQPLPVTKFIAFAQAALRLAAGGDTVGSEALIGIAAECGVVEVQGGGFVYTGAALVAMGAMIAALPKDQVAVRSALPAAPVVGDQISFEVGGINKRHRAKFGVMHEDGHFSISQDYMFATVGGTYGFSHYRYATFEDAMAACVFQMMKALRYIVDSPSDTQSQSERASAQGGLKWIGSRLADWGIVPADNRLPNVPVVDEPTLPLGDRAPYEAALAALTEPKGKLHQSTARDALAAGLAAKVPVREMARDLGHPLGTVQSWTHRLGLTDPNNSPINGAAE